MLVFANNTGGTVTSGGTTTGDTSWTVSSVTGFPASLAAGDFFHVADPAQPGEKVKVTGVSGSGPYTWTVVRGDEGSTAVAHAANFTVQQVVTAGDYAGLAESGGTADYVISADGSTVYCTAADGAVAYSGSDGGAALTAAITALASTGGTVAFRAGTYPWSTVPQLPTGLPEWLRILGNGAKISLSAAAPRFLDFNHSPAALAVFQNIWVEGFHVDLSGVTPSGSNHVMIGTDANGSWSAGNNVSFARIVVRNMRGTGAATTTLTTSTTEQMWIFIASVDTQAGSRTNTGTDILIENIDITGGNQGVVLYSSWDFSSPAFDVGFTWDRVTIRNIKHDIGSDPDNSGSLAYAHVQVGSDGHVGTLWVENIWGRGSRDVGIEIDNALDAHVRNVYMRNVHGAAITCTNFNAPANVHAQCYSIEDVTLVRDGGVLASNACAVVALYANSDNLGAQQPFGRLRCSGLKCFVDGTSMQDIVTAPLGGMLLLATHTPDEILLENSFVYAVNLQQTSASTQGKAIAVEVYNPGSGVQKYKLTLRNLDAWIAGVNNAGATPALPIGYWVSSDCDLDMDNCSAGFSFTTPGSGNQIGLAVSSGSLGGSGGTVSGKIGRFRISGMNDPGGYGMTIGGTSALTIPGQLVISDCDFSGIPSGGHEVNFESTSNAAKVPVLGKNTWIAMPKLPYTISAPASGTAQQYLQGWNATLAVTATTITAASVSADNTTFYSVFPTGVSGTLTAFSFPVKNGQYFKVTYTGTLTVNVVPDA